MSNDITELRETLFATLRDLRAGKMDADKAKAINDTAQTIINTVKVEVDFMRMPGVNAPGTSFFPADNRTPALPGGTSVVQELPGVRITQHRLKG